jgi:hypothetical protein
MSGSPFFGSRFSVALSVPIFLAIVPLYAQDCVRVTGIVSDDRGAAVADATLQFSDGETANPLQRGSAGDGSFSVCLAHGGLHQVTVTHPSYLQLSRKVLIEPSGTHLDLSLNAPLTLHESLDVHADSLGLPTTTAPVQNSLGTREAMNIPFEGRDLWPMLALMPGIVQDPLGRMHMGGSQINQVQCRLDSFTITNPISGECEMRLNPNSIETLTYATGQYSSEYGKGSAGLLNIGTRMGTDAFRYEATNFVPGVDLKMGLHLGSWAPRFEVSGPVLKRRIWFFESGGMDYVQTLVEDLKKNNQTSSLRFNNHLRTQINVAPTVLVHAAFVANAYNAPRFGLSGLDPYSTTVDHRDRTWFSSVKQTKFFRNGGTLEVGYAEYRTFARAIPQGPGMLLFTPFGRLGNNFVNLEQNSDRRQTIVNYAAPKIHHLGVHQFRMGLDIDNASYRQDVSRSGYQHLGLNGQLLNQTTFGGSGIFRRPTADASAYLEDAWSIKPQILLTAGMREDWDDLLHKRAFSPRLGLAYFSEALGVRFSAGYAVTRDAGFLPLFVQSRDQYSITDDFNSDGTLAHPPRTTLSSASGAAFEFPSYQNYSIGAEKALPRSLTVKTSLVRRRGNDGLTYVAEPVVDPSRSVLQLMNYRRDLYDSAEMVVRQPLAKDHEWQVSYTRSRALSNAVVNLAVDTPVGVPLNVGPMPWDSPNRLMAWGYLPTPWETWSIASLVEARNGFPYSVEDPSGMTIGAVNSRRYPMYFNLDLHVEHTFRLGKHRVAVRAGATNITNHLNPSMVDDVIGSPRYLQYYGSRGRHFMVRIRWLDPKTK